MQMMTHSDFPLPWNENGEGARPRRVDDKYWQITAKDGEMAPTRYLLHSDKQL
jgi:hypothetical protein